MIFHALHASTTWIANYLHLLFDLLVEMVFGLFARKEVAAAPKDELVCMSAMQLAQGIRRRRFTSEEVVRAHIWRIKEVNGLLNAMVDHRFSEAIAEAIATDEFIAKADASELDAKPFLGVPFTSKESTHCKDLSLTFGLQSRKGFRAAEDAVVIKQMKDAGAILLGVTNVPSLNMWTETHNPVYGQTKNPYDTSRIVGGSSGGEGSIIAACGSPFGVGTDIGGSIRIPAYMCGIFGHKCSTGLTNTKGLTFRDGSEIDTTMACAGPMSRRAEDLIPGVKVILGAKANILNLDTPVDTSQLKYYYIERNGDLRCSPIRADVNYINTLVQNHFKRNRVVEKLEVPLLRYSSSLYKYWIDLELNSFDSDITNRKHKVMPGRELWKYLTLRSEFPFSVIMLLLNCKWLPTPKDTWARSVTNELSKFFIDKLSDNGVLLFPSWPQAATYHHVSYLRPYNFAYASIFNVLKFPVTQVPLGLNVDGLPMGIQVVAAPMQDRLCLAVAMELEKMFGGYTPLPKQVAPVTG